MPNYNYQKFNLCDWVIEPKELANFSTFETSKTKMDAIFEIDTTRLKIISKFRYIIVKTFFKKSYLTIFAHTNNTNMGMKYKRILLKLSGEALMGDRQYGIDPQRLAEYAAEIKQIHDKGVEIAIVIGGGNIFRGVARCKQRNGQSAR